MINELINENYLPDDTPYFLFDKGTLKKRLSHHKKTAEHANVKLIYSVKSLSHIEILKEIAKYVAGFSVSSVFEARLVEGISNNQHTVHFVSPGIKTGQWSKVSQSAHFITFNSLEQYAHFKDKLHSDVSYGLRLNPELSFVKDARYNPCRDSSKLGVPLEETVKFLKNSDAGTALKGLHFHNNCDSCDFLELEKTFKKIESYLSRYFKQFQWINLGGGYILDAKENLPAFYKLTQYIRTKYQFERIIIEPGASIVRDSVYLVSSVIDVFKRGGKNIAVLDTTTNHLPEVFEYQYQPDILECDSSGSYEYILAGCSCLAGDVFGAYFFKNKLKTGSKVIFNKVGGYSLVKAHRFNGINLPDIYCIENNIELKKIKSYTFNDYVSHCGG